MKNAPEPDDIYTGMIVAAGEAGLTEFTNLSNMMYKEGCFPEQMNKSVFITLPKIRGTVQCEKHRTISLMSHATRLGLRVIMNIIQGRTFDKIENVKYVSCLTDKQEMQYLDYVG